MSESQKGKSVQRNQIGNQKQRNRSEDINENQESETSEQSSGSDEEEGLAEEINEHKAFKHPHRQGSPEASEDENENGL